MTGDSPGKELEARDSAPSAYPPASSVESESPEARVRTDRDARRVILDERILREAVDQFAAIVGAEHVVRASVALEAISRATVPDARMPSAIVYPGTAEETARIVKAASTLAVPLWPCSKGKNWGYGSAAPFLEGTVLLHLERLDRILEVNEELAYAVVEPGVTYRMLREHLSRHYPNMWCDCTDGPPDGSVIGNALERGVGVTPYCDHFATLCGLEVILSDGSIIRTGGGGVRSHTWHTHKWGFGPYIEGLFSQSNLGVVTRAGVWLMRKPQRSVSFAFDLKREERLPDLIDQLRELQLEGILAPGAHVVNRIVALAVVSQYPRNLVGQVSRLPDDVVQAMSERLGVPTWGLGGAIHGGREHVDASLTSLRLALRGLGRLHIVTDQRARLLEGFGELLKSLDARSRLRSFMEKAFLKLSGKSIDLAVLAPTVHRVMKGIPSDYFVRHAYFKSRLEKPERADPDRDGCGLIWFAPVAPCTGSHVNAVLEASRPLFEQFAFDFYVALIMQNARSVIVLMSIFYDRDNADEEDRARTLYEALSKAMQAAGYPQYRTGTQGMATLFADVPEYADLLRRLKKAIDPVGVLAPGKLPP
jgi:4-cresol dehydrogenase (hydroxylating)